MCAFPKFLIAYIDRIVEAMIILVLNKNFFILFKFQNTFNSVPINWMNKLQKVQFHLLCIVGL